MTMIEFTAEDLAYLPTLGLWQDRLDWLHECAWRPDRPSLVHRSFFADADDRRDAVRHVRQYVDELREQFYENGELPHPHQVVAELLYRSTVS
jgi:hypothetical protein